MHQFFLIDKNKISYSNKNFLINLFESLANKARIVDKIYRFKSFALKIDILYYIARIYISKFG